MVSLVFVFAAMVEFAFVLFMKRKQQWINMKGIDGHCDNPLDRITINAATNSPKFLCFDTTTTQACHSVETSDQETRPITFFAKHSAMLHVLPLTTKIDLAGFVIFHISYFIFNCLYLVSVMKELYRK